MSQIRQDIDEDRKTGELIKERVEDLFGKLRVTEELETVLTEGQPSQILGRWHSPTSYNHKSKR